jgi:hypothetical protein
MAASRALLARALLLRLRISPLSSAHGLLRGGGSTPPPPRPFDEWRRAFHDGRPRGPLWRSKKLIGKEALFAIQGLKRFKGDEEKLREFVKRHVARLLKADKLAVLGELERQEEVDLSVKVRTRFAALPLFDFCDGEPGQSCWLISARFLFGVGELEEHFLPLQLKLFVVVKIFATCLNSWIEREM